MSGHKRTRFCPDMIVTTRFGTNMCGQKLVWAQTCVGTIVCGHKRVWAQSCVGTNVYGPNRVVSPTDTNIPPIGKTSTRLLSMPRPSIS